MKAKPKGAFVIRFGLSLWCANVLGSGLAYAADAGLVTHSMAFINACRPESNDREFGGELLAFVHEVGSGETTLYTIYNGQMEYFASLTPRTTDRKEMVEVQGGIRSQLVGEAAVAFMRRQPFFLLEDWRSAILGETPFSVGRCHVDYRNVRRYDAGKWTERSSKGEE